MKCENNKVQLNPNCSINLNTVKKNVTFGPTHRKQFNIFYYTLIFSALTLTAQIPILI